MAELERAYAVRSYSSGTRGRAINNARNHHWIADDPGGDEIGAGELFLSGISACAVNMIERIANEEEIPLDWMDVSVEAYRETLTPSQASALSIEDINIHLQMWGVCRRRRRYPGGHLETPLSALWFGCSCNPKHIGNVGVLPGGQAALGT